MDMNFTGWRALVTFAHRTVVLKNIDLVSAAALEELIDGVDVVAVGDGRKVTIFEPVELGDERAGTEETQHVCRREYCSLVVK